MFIHLDGRFKERTSVHFPIQSVDHLLQSSVRTVDLLQNVHFPGVHSNQSSKYVHNRTTYQCQLSWRRKGPTCRFGQTR